MKCPKCQHDNPPESAYCGKCATRIRGRENRDSPRPSSSRPNVTETLETPLKELTTGSTFARRYQVIEELGRGGMGRVYKALDAEIREKVALKILKPDIASDAETIERFRNELRLARKISHKNVCRMYDLSHEQGTQFITMEYVEGENLKSLMRRMGPFSVGKAASVARQVCEGLAEAHRLGVVHRDLKPQNIMIDNEGNVRIMDFGIARSLRGKGITDARVMIGTPEYMSPEQVEGAEVDGRADIYALGIVLYEMLTGRVPFEGDTALSVALKHKTELPPDPRGLNPQIPEALGALILRCLEKDKAKRHESVQALISDLDKIETALTPTSGIVRPALPAKSRRKGARIAAAALIVLAAAVAVFFTVRPGRLDVNPKRVVVAPFENKTGDPSLDSVGGIAADWITQGISQAAQIEVVPGMAAQESFKIVEKEGGRLQGMNRLRALGRETGAGVVVSGTYYLQEGNLHFQANITDVQKKKLVYALPSISGGKDVPMEVIRALQQRVMGAIASCYNLELKVIMGASPPPPFEAYQEFMRGMELFGKDYARSYAHFSKASELDPAFLMPKAIMATGYSNQGNFEKARELFEELNQKRTRLDQFTRLWTDSMMAEMEGRLEESLRYCRELANFMPNSAMMLYNIGLQERWLNRPRKAVEEFSKIDLEVNGPNSGADSWLFSEWAIAYHMLGKYKKELEIVKQGEKYFPDYFWFLAIEARSYAAQGKIDKVRDVIRRSLTTASVATMPADVMAEAAVELRAHGHPDESRRVAGQAVDWHKGRPAEEAAKEGNRAALGRALYFAERWQEARDIYEALLSEKPEDIDYKGFSGFLAARLGDKEQALRISGELKGLTKPYLFGNHTYCRACIAALLGDKEQAVALLRESFSQGRRYGVDLHRDPHFESLRDYPPFKELLRPKG